MKQAFSFSAKCLLAATISLSVINCHAYAAEEQESINARLKNIESKTEGRLGVFAINTGNGTVIEYRADEVFPAGCTSKAIGVAAILKKSMNDPALLSKKVKYSKDDLEEWSPITEKYVAEGMTIKDLASASIIQSDNTAMNLILKELGGVEGMNDFARSIGDKAFRQDSDWPAEAYSGGAGNVKDSTTPKAMIESLQKLTLSDVLSRPQSDMLTTWLINTESGYNRIRAGLPKGWIVGDKTGTGGVYGTTNDIAIVWPKEHAPILIGVYYTSDDKKAKKREDVVSNSTRMIIEEFKKNDKNLK